MDYKKIFQIELLIVFCLIYSCTNNFEKRDIAGRYESYVPHLSFEGYIIGEVLLLNKDSTYNYQTCGNVIKGKWKLNNTKDSLLLYCFDFKYKNDSLNKLRSTIVDSNIAMDEFKLLKGGFLLERVRNKKNKKMVNIKLIKIEKR